MLTRLNLGHVFRVVVPAALCAVAVAHDSELVSVATGGAQANNDSYYSLVSDDGRYIVFQSEASNLVPGDINNKYDIFRRDLVTEATELVSVATNGNSASGLSLSPTVSGDGRFVAWSSDAANLIVGDTNGTWDVFLRDMDAGVTTRVSVDADGNQVFQRSDGAQLSPDGKYVIFESDAALLARDTNGIKDCYRRNLIVDLLDLVSVTQSGGQGNGISYAPQISDDGLFACFFSSASNLVPGDSNGWGDVFWKDMRTGELLRVNVSSAGGQSNGESIWPYVSGDGLTVTFCSRGSNLVAGDTNSNWDLFAHDMLTAETSRLNVRPDGGQANSYVRSPSAMSSDGRYVIFASLSTNLVPGDTNGFQDAFVRDRALEETFRVTFGADGSETDDDSFVPHMTPDLNVVTFTSEARNVVDSDTNGRRDIFATYFLFRSAR